MRRTLRASWRLLAVGIVIAGGSLVYWGGRLLLLPSPVLRTTWRRRVFHRWSAVVLRTLRVRLRVTGEAPQAPFFLVGNHLSYLDIIVLASRLHAVFIAKREVAGWPVLGPICASLDTIFIDRTSRRDLPRVLAEARAAFARGDGVVVFPEGTSTAGAEVLPFRPSLLELPARLEVPVHHAALSYATGDGDPAPDSAVCYWRDMKFPGHFWGLLGLSRIDAHLVFGAEPIAGSDRKELAARLHQAVSRDLAPMVGSTP